MVSVTRAPPQTTLSGIPPGVANWFPTQRPKLRITILSYMSAEVNGEFSGAPDWIRTSDHKAAKLGLYPLSYGGTVWSIAHQT